MSRVSKKRVKQFIPEAIELKDQKLREKIEKAEERIRIVDEKRMSAIGRLEDARNTYGDFRLQREQFLKMVTD